MPLSDDKQAFNTTSRYLNINNIHFDNIVKVRKRAKIRNR